MVVATLPALSTEQRDRAVVAVAHAAAAKVATP